jgi:hypothetical protein
MKTVRKIATWVTMSALFALVINARPEFLSLTVVGTLFVFMFTSVLVAAFSQICLWVIQVWLFVKPPDMGNAFEEEGRKAYRETLEARTPRQ